MKVLNYIFVVFSLSCMLSCATDIVDMTGSIVGTVKDASSNTGIEGCLVTLTPSNLSKTTNSAGQVSFEDLDAGTYSLAFAKDGYESLTKDLPVTAGKNTSVEILLKPTLQEISVNPASLNFGDLETTKELYLSKSGGNDTQFSIKANQKWMSVSPESGILGKTNVKITVVVNRNELSAGEYQGTITITSSFGETFVPVFMSKVESSAPQVSIGASCYEVTENSFKIDGVILHTGGNEITSYGHCWSKNENPTIADSKTNFGNTKEIGEYTSQINQGIIAGETYYVRAYAVNKVGESYSNAVRITIPKITTPTVVTLAAKDITKTSAVINGSIADTGNGQITECGFYYGKTNNPTIKIANTSVATNFAYSLLELEEGCTYYYKAYAKNAKGESCGEVLPFSTLQDAKLTVETLSAKDVTTKSATINGKITDKGTGEITECGFYYGKTSNPTIKITNTSVATDFSYSLLQLEDGTTYYYKAYAKNEKGESYGEVLSFSTFQVTKPTVVTLSAKDINTNSAAINGSITDTGNGNITECGFYYGKTSNPTTKVTNASVTTNFSYSLLQLADNTTYYYKAYAKNEKGESYGDVLSFSTLQDTPKQGVVTENATGIAYSSATLNASIWGEFEGAKKLSDYGFYIGTNQYQLQKKYAKDIASNSFDLTVTGLNPETKYYYYAYVLCYDRTELKGDLLTFTTNQKPKITYVKYACSKTVDDELWLNLTATIDPAGLKLIDAGFLMGNVTDSDNLHSSYNQITIVPCDFQDDTVKYDDIAKDYITWSKTRTCIKPYFVFEDGTEVYGKTVELRNGTKTEQQY